MHVDVQYEVVFEVISIDPIRHIAEIATQVINKETNKMTIRGTGTLMNEDNY